MRDDRNGITRETPRLRRLFEDEVHLVGFPESHEQGDGDVGRRFRRERLEDLGPQGARRGLEDPHPVPVPLLVEGEEGVAHGEAQGAEHVSRLGPREDGGVSGDVLSVDEEGRHRVFPITPPAQEEGGPLPVGGFGEKGGAVFHELLDHPAALLREDAGENEVSARGRPPQEFGGHVDQDLRDQVSKDQVEGAGDRGQGSGLRAEHVRHAVLRGILRGDVDRHRVGVDPEDTLRAEARRGDPEDARSRPHVEGVTWGRERSNTSSIIRRHIRVVSWVPVPEGLSGVDRQHDLALSRLDRLP